MEISLIATANPPELMQKDDWYDTPLYYDIVFDQGTREEAAFLEAMHRRHGTARRSPSLLEPACGSGRLVREMVRRGWRVAGFDANANTLAYARKRIRAPEQRARVRFWEDGMERFTLPRTGQFDLVHCLVSTFKYLGTEAEALAFLQRVTACLKPGGIFVLGLHLTDYGNTHWLHERWVAKRGRIKVTCNTRTWPMPLKPICDS